jgi:hypothetical protein
MDEDFETYKRNKKNKRTDVDEGDDFPSMATDMVRGINWKVALFIYILGIFVFSDIFIETFLTGFNGAVDGDCPTTKGTMIQLTFIVVGYVLFDLLVKGACL